MRISRQYFFACLLTTLLPGKWFPICEKKVFFIFFLKISTLSGTIFDVFASFASTARAMQPTQIKMQITIDNNIDIWKTKQDGE
jgi:hypothetical protein